MFYDNLKNLVLREFDGDTQMVNGMEALGILDDIPVVKYGTPLDSISHYLNKRLAYGNFD